MKHKPIKHVLAALLVFCMVLTMLPVSVLAVDVQANPGNKTIPVEYFTSTLYNWNEDGANNATAAADFAETGTREETHLRWSILTRDYVNYVFYAGYAVKVGNNYYPAYGKYNGDDSYSIYYRTDGATNQYYQNTNGQNLVATYDVPDTNVYITDPTGTLATETVDGTENVVIFYGASADGHYEKKGFYFTNGAVPGVFNGDKKNNYPAFSLWVDTPNGQAYSKQEFHIYSGLAAQDLSESDNVPFNNDTVNAADLFSTTEYDWKDVYQNVSVPFYVDDDGYYVLDSDLYGVYFTNGVNAARNGATMAIADRPSCHDGNKTGFLPFNTLSNNTVQAEQSASSDKVTAYTIKEGTVFGFGMVTEVKFQMTDDGKDADGDPIMFEFSGDDDVWVFIDDKLVLDVGGTHGAIKGTVNFANGEVHLSSPRYGTQDVDGDGTKNGVGDYATGVEATNNDLQQKNLYGANGVFGTTLTGFSAQGEHTMKIFYLERGRGRSNCLIKFNLPQRDTIEVTKKFDSAMDNDGNTSAIDSKELESYGGREFGFTLYENGSAVANKTYYVYDSNNNSLLRTASTDAAGHFILHRNETARFLVAISADESNSYYVVEDTMTVDTDGFVEPTWTYTTNITGATGEATVNSFTGMTVTATGSDTAADTISFVCENYLSTNVPNPGVKPQDDRIVIDYGLPITINVSDLLKNDIIRGEQRTVSLIGTDGNFGTAVYNDVGTDGDYTNDTITYTLNKQLTGIETLTYQVQVTGSGNTGSEQTSETATATGKVLIMPATSMYYEENFGTPTKATIDDTDYISYGLVSYSDATTKWNSVGTANGGNQETGIVGTIGDSTYGSDVVYLTGTGDSYGTSMHASTTGAAAQFVYDFTGTGTAIYGRVSATTGYIRVIITDEHNKEVDTKFIDTVALANVGSASELYNIPVYLNNTLAHGTYHVEVRVYKAGATTTNSNGAGADFYLDGIRIYNPVVDNGTVNTAYADDGEANTVVLNIRDKILGDNSNGYLSGKFFTLTDVNGEVIADESGTTLPGGNTATVTDYSVYGPNHEFYLNNAGTDNEVYTVSFKLINWDAQLYKLYLGMKAPGNSATVTVGGTEITLNNSTDCYYDISNYVTVSTETIKGESCNVGTVTISGKTGLASLTNIKVTGVDAFTLGTSEDLMKDIGEIEGNTAKVLYMVPRTFSLNEETDEVIPDETVPEETVPEETVPEETVPEETVPEETVPEETVPEEEKPAEVFVPKSISVDCSYTRILKSATVKVKASSDVAYITVNGARVSGARLLGSVMFVSTQRQVQSGETIEVIAYNSNGVASASYTATVK